MLFTAVTITEFAVSLTKEVQIKSPENQKLHYVVLNTTIWVNKVFLSVLKRCCQHTMLQVNARRGLCHQQDAC